MKSIPKCPSSLPDVMSNLLLKMGGYWSKHKGWNIDKEIVSNWENLLEEWANNDELPLLIRISGVRGSVVVHAATQREIIITDNSPAQWSCSQALLGLVPVVSEIQGLLDQGKLPIAFAHKKAEANKRKYHGLLGKHTVNKAGWKLCHIKNVGSYQRKNLQQMNIDELKPLFKSLLSPSNYFLIPKEWGGLGEVPEFINGYQASA